MLKFKKYLKKFNKEIKNINNINFLEKIRIKYLSKKGYINKFIKNIKKISLKLRPKIGKKINKIKKYIKNKINILKKKILKKNIKKTKKKIDISLPGKIPNIGNKHIINITLNKIEKFFEKIGFDNISGNEIEDIYHNFDALNINKYHPSRSKKDTFWINKNYLLRTQTSCLQTRYIKKNKPPIKIITSGCVFRRDYDKTHTPTFHQLDLFLIDKNINFSNLKYIIFKFLFYYFNKKIKIKFLPSYFPFTEPSAEVFIKNQQNKWIEILGCGLIHPKILKNLNINNKIYSGIAFGLGIERLIMIKYNIKNIKLLYENNIKLLKQF